jgi:hypothetical protein
MRRILIWLIGTQLMTGSMSVHFDARVDVHVRSGGPKRANG